LRERFDAGTGLVALGAVLLLVSLFIDWFDPTGDAWAAFEIADVVLAAAAAACLLAIVPRYSALQRSVPAIAFAALFVVAVQLIDAPPSARGDDIEAGGWLALGATALMTVGATLSAASISVTVDVRGRDRRRRTPAIDAREREAEEPAAPAAPGDEPAPVVAAGETRRPRRRAGAAAASSGAGAGSTAAAEPAAAGSEEQPRRGRRPAEAGEPTGASEEQPRRGRRPAEAGEPTGASEEQPRRTRRPADAAAPHADDVPTTADPTAPDPDRTQALDPVDRPREGS
jgi:hypothetical protein